MVRLASLLFCVAILWTPLKDPDFWWHLRLGQQILATGSIPRADTLSWIAFGRPFVDFYWLWEIIIAWLFSHTGPFFLTLIFALLGTLTIYLAVGRQGKFSWTSAAVMIILSLALKPALDVRPVVISWLGFVLLLWFIDKLPKLSYWQIILFGCLLFIPWMNMHDGFVLPLLYMLLVLIGSIARTMYDTGKLRRSNLLFGELVKEHSKMVILLFVALGALFVTPYGLSYIQTLHAEAMSPHNRAYIYEWAPLTIDSQMGLLYFVFVGATVCLAAFRKAWRLEQWITYGFLALLGTYGFVHAPFILLLLLPLTIPLVSRFHIALPASQMLNRYFMLVFLIASGVFILLRAVSIHQSSIATQTQPVQAVTYLGTHTIQGNVYNYYNWGGFLDYYLPEHKVFLDGRMSSWFFNGHSLLEDSMTLELLKPGFENVLRTYQPDWFLLQRDLPIVSWMKASPNYQIIYEDQIAIIFKPE